MFFNFFKKKPRMYYSKEAGRMVDETYTSGGIIGKYTLKNWETDIKQQTGMPNDVKDVDKWLHSGEMVKCIDCGKMFYLRLHGIEDCLARGEARGHRIKGVKYVPWY